MILLNKTYLLNALNTELDEYAELGDVIKFIEDYEKYHSVIRGEGKPLLIINDQALYLTDEHIEALKEYERKKMHEELVNRFIANIEQIKELDGVFPSIKKLEPDAWQNCNRYDDTEE